MAHRTLPPSAGPELPALLEVPPAVVAALGLPERDTLTEEQWRGAVCVWGTERLRVDTAVDLGQLDSGDGRWWPRSCPACITDRAHKALLDHGSACRDCLDDEELCPVGRILYRLARDGRRA